jgi:hypothetical protein
VRDPRVEREKSTLQWRDGGGGGGGGGSFVVEMGVFCGRERRK